MSLKTHEPTFLIFDLLFYQLYIYVPFICYASLCGILLTILKLQM